MKKIKINNNSVDDDFKDTELVRVRDVLESLNQLKGEIMSLPNRDDKIGARILMPDGGGVNKFVVTNKIDDLIKHLSGKEE